VSHLVVNHPTYRDEYDEFKRRSLTLLEIFDFVHFEMLMFLNARRKL
jgi:hypothetical protein